MKAELKSLPKELAEIVAAHLMAAGELIDIDPALAWRHAEAARRRAARLPMVREAAAETAYAAGEYAVALNEFRALRRMSGSDDYLPVMADCERALGRHEAALRLVREGDASLTDAAMLAELAIVQAGIRSDMGQTEEAHRILRAQIEHPKQDVPKPAQARLRYAYANLLLEAGDEASAREWFVTAARLDPEGQTDALDRLDELDGMVLEIDEDDDLGEIPEPDPDAEPEPEDEDGDDADAETEPDAETEADVDAHTGVDISREVPTVTDEHEGVRRVDDA